MKTTAEKLDILTIEDKLYVISQEIWTREEIILSDVLVWLYNHSIPVEMDWTGSMDIWDQIELWKYLERDLTKPYLSEQSEEVVNWLYEVSLLIKNNRLWRK